MCSSDCSEHSSGERFRTRRSIFRQSSFSSESSDESYIPSRDLQKKDSQTNKHDEIFSTSLKSASSKRQKEQQDREEVSEGNIGDGEKSGRAKCFWNVKDEEAFLNVIAECTEKGEPLPTYAFLCNHAKNILGSKYSDKQLYNKLRRLKRKFKDAVNKMEKPGFSFGNPHEEMVFRLSKKIWGEEVEGIEKNEDEKNYDGIDPNMEEDNELDINKGDQNVGKDSAAHASDGVQENMMLYGFNAELSREKVKVSGSCLIEFIKDVVIESMDSVKDFFKGLLKENMLAMSKHKDELLAANENMLNRVLEPSQSCLCNRRTYTNLEFCLNEMIPSFFSFNSMVLPTLSESKIYEHKRKRVEHEADEMEAGIKRSG